MTRDSAQLDRKGPGGPDLLAEPTLIIDLHPGGPERPLGQWARGALRNAVLDNGLQITPVLGPECLDADGEPATRRGPAGLIQRIYLSDLETSIRQHSDERRRIFFNEVKRGRLLGRVTIKRESPDEPVHKDLIALQTALFESAYQATTAYASTWKDTPIPVTDWLFHAVGVGDDALRMLCSALEVAIEAVERFTDRPPGDPTAYLLGATSIEMRLRSLLGGLKAGELLQGSWVEWLTDLFWHTVVFDSPCYPRVDEFALQVSLVGTSKDSPIRHLEPTGTIERDSLQVFREAVVRSIGRGFDHVDPQTVRDGFHGALATVLHAQFAEWEKRSQDMGRPFPFPMAISTTFDLEFERALALAKAPRHAMYHVAFPAVISGPERGRGRLRWLIGRFRVLTPKEVSGSVERLRELLTVPEGEGWRWLDDVTKVLNTPELDGPLILKVNGSPLHELNANLDENPGLVVRPSSSAGGIPAKGGLMFSRPRAGETTYTQRLYHAPALAEIDVLQITHIDEWSYGARHGANPDDSTIDQGLPSAITTQLDHPDRFWLIAGQRLADWSVRMQLFLHVCRALVKGTGLPNALAVSREFDRDRARLLDGLGISRASGDFETLARVLHRIAGDVNSRVRGGKP